MPAVSARHTLVLGGARSGKSRHAQRLCEDSGRRLVFCATAGEAADPEMAARIARHRAERDVRWHTVDAPLALGAMLAEATAPDAVVLVDCLTLWLTNVMLAGDDVEAAGRALVDGLPALAGPAVFVSNEVGSGIVPDNALARRFRDAQGRLNQGMAAACEAAVLVVAGLPLVLKGVAAPGPGLAWRPAAGPG